jgi:hypothetical protein
MENAMNARDSRKTILFLVALAIVSSLAGGLLGRRLARAEFEQRSDPHHWNESAIHELERRLKPTSEQRDRIQAHLDVAVEELVGVREETIRRSAAIILRLVDQVEKELTPEQRTAFEEMKPRPSDLSNLNFLNVESRTKKDP